MPYSLETTESTRVNEAARYLVGSPYDGQESPYAGHESPFPDHMSPHADQENPSPYQEQAASSTSKGKGRASG